MRTTIDLDAPILADLKRLGRVQGKSLGRLVSDLLAEALRAQQKAGRPERAFVWTAKPMGARADLADREALYDSLDRGSEP
jgi:hypothetical protein